MKKKIVTILMTGVICASLAACGSDSGTTVLEQTEEPAAEEQASEEAEDVQTEETDTQLSGKVVVYMPSPSGLNEKYVEAFEESTGVEVELFEGTTGEILARLEAEKENPVADVVVLASWSDGLSLKETGALQSYAPENVDKLYSDWVDDDSMLFGTSASAVGVIYNTTLIDNLDADWTELLDEQYRDMIAIPDPEKSGSCKDFLAGYMYANDEDWSLWEGLADLGMVVPGANKAALESVTTGEKAILLAGVDYNAYSSMADGEPLALYYPESGTVINPRPAMILNTSSNLENAQAFVDFLLSDTAQQLVADAYLLPGRTDIACSNRTNVSDIPTFDLDWNWMLEHSDDIAANLNALCE
ncbi:MAG: ABC transporter substrate-binding protein [Eubacteriales bacterium]|nr:ABC transporter substrate-binding protein [Eubacteriales bacterium]